MTTTLSDLGYSDVKTFLASGLSARDDLPRVAFSPGPSTSMQLQKLSPDAMIFILVGGGPGLHLENLYDRRMIQIRVIGPQGDFNAAEKLAKYVDRLFCQVDRNAVIGEAKVNYIARAGGAPLLLDYDNADRHHFTCSYIADTQTGL